MGMPLLKTIKHLFEKHVLLSEMGGEFVHVRVWRLALEPQLGVGAYDVLDAVGVKQHQGEVLKLAVHWDGLILLCCPTHVNTILRLTLGNDTWRGSGD